MAKIYGFTFFNSYYESLKDLETDDRRELLEAIVNYVFDDVEPELAGFKRTIWTLMLPYLTTSKNKSKNAQKEPKQNQKKNKSKSKTKQKEINDLLENKEIENEKEMKRNEIEKEGENYTSSTTRSIYELIEENFGRPLSPIEFEKIQEWEKDYDQEIIEYAVRKSVLYNKRTFNYVNGILRNWKTSGLRTLQEIKDAEVKMYEHRESKIDSEFFDFNWLEDDSDE